MDMTLIRKKAKILGPLPEYSNKRSIQVTGDRVYTVTRQIPVPVKDSFGYMKKDREGAVLYTILPLTLHLTTISYQRVSKLADKVCERELEAQWERFNYQSRPWSVRTGESVRFKFVDREGLDEYRELEVLVEEK